MEYLRVFTHQKHAKNNWVLLTRLLTCGFIAGLLIISQMAVAGQSAARQIDDAPAQSTPPVIAAPPEKTLAETTTIDVKLKGYVFGLRLMKAHVSGTLTKNSYAIRAELFTSGVGAFLKKFQIWATTTGHIEKTGLRPSLHIQQNLNKKNRRVEMRYGEDSVDVSIIPRLGSLGKPPASEKQRFESDDTLTALLNMMMRGYQFTDKPCTGTVPVFDSKQHYLLRMELAGTKYIKQKGYKGATVRCNVYYVPVSGFDPEDLPSDEEAAAPVKIYLAKNDDVGLYFPVRMTYKISFFKAVIKIREISISQQ